jgi:subtilisin family serine protease
MHGRRKALNNYNGRKIITQVINGRSFSFVEGLSEDPGAEFRIMAAPLGMVAGPPPLAAIHEGAAAVNDPLVDRQEYLERIGVAAAWSRWNGNPSSVRIAVIDSGVPVQGGALSHEDLRGSRFVLRENFQQLGALPIDQHGHGTHVLGLCAANRDNGLGIAGIAPPCEVWVYKVFNEQNQGLDTLFAAAVDRAISETPANVRLIINYSGEGPDTAPALTAINRAKQRGALVVAAAGNQGTAPGNSMMFPAGYANGANTVIAVGAVDSTNQRASFSSRGAALSVVAPGVNIFSTLPNYPVTLAADQSGYGALDGTSMATPLVTGLAALIWSHRSDISALKVKQIILGTASPLGSSFETGAGLINAAQAMAQVSP